MIGLDVQACVRGADGPSADTYAWLILRLGVGGLTERERGGTPRVAIGAVPTGARVDAARDHGRSEPAGAAPGPHSSSRERVEHHNCRYALAAAVAGAKAVI